MKVQAISMELRPANSLSLELDQMLAERQGAALEQLQGFWRALEYAFQERLTELATTFRERFQQALEAERRTVREAARHELTAALDEAVRRLRYADTFELWASALLDAASVFSRRVALLAVEGERLRAVDARGLTEDARDQFCALDLPLGSAPALASAVENRDSVIAQRTRGELTEALTAVFGESPDSRACLVPVTSAGSVVAVLYADNEDGAADAAGLELVALLAGGGLRVEVREVASAPAAAPPEAPAAPRPLPDWSQLSREDQELHLRAQRFARVQAAEMRLYKSEAVARGRANRNLYSALKSEIDAARAAFREQFLDASPTMVDYLHQELVRTLAHEDAALLGKDYPGPLV